MQATSLILIISFTWVSCMHFSDVIQQLDIDIDMHVILQVHVGYKNPKTYILTRQRKKLGREWQEEARSICNGMHEKLNFGLKGIE